MTNKHKSTQPQLTFIKKDETPKILKEKQISEMEFRCSGGAVFSINQINQFKNIISS